MDYPKMILGRERHYGKIELRTTDGTHLIAVVDKPLARQFAASGKMLEALKECFDYLRRAAKEELRPDDSPLLMAVKARAAIMAATGEGGV